MFQYGVRIKVFPGNFPRGSLVPVIVCFDTVHGIDCLIHCAECQDALEHPQPAVQLVVRGYPNELIAKKLGISTGTVRNYRHRLYFKLDITSERELFNMLLMEITGTPES